ncbi:MAG: hypothetical protein IJV98_09000 [Clostridia bacterium]|nr:hypothetical protein [Clostridia bacterium]
MRKRCFVYLFILAASLVACTKRSVPVYADAGELARSVYEAASFDTEAIYGTSVRATDAYLFGVTVSDFERMVEDAVCWRRTVDSDGEMLYALKTRSEKDARTLARSFLSQYEFAPCDAAQKLAVAATGTYLIVFKSSIGEVDAAVEAFCSVMDGHLLFEREIYNRL